MVALAQNIRKRRFGKSKSIICVCACLISIALGTAEAFTLYLTSLVLFLRQRFGRTHQANAGNGPAYYFFADFKEPHQSLKKHKTALRILFRGNIPCLPTYKTLLAWICSEVKGFERYIWK